MKENQELIVVKQLPIIEEHLKMLAKEIDEEIKKATSLMCNAETVKEVKKVKANLNNKFKDLESKRIQVKKIVEKPYKDFEVIYKEYVSEKFKNADSILKEKIEEVEGTLKKEIKEKLESYFNEYAVSKNVNFLTFEEANFKIKLGLSTEKGELTKKAKEMVTSFINKVDSDIKTIETQGYQDEILIEYKKTLDLNESIQKVVDRHKELEKVQIQKEESKEQQITDEEMLNKIDSLSAPKVEIKEQKQIFESPFVVRTDNKNCLIEIKNIVKKYNSEIKTLVKEGDIYHE